MSNAEIETAPVATVEVLEQLTPDEERERHRLELRVERAFVEAGSSLRELRDKRLYRSTHRTFEEYCQDRFGFQRAHSYRLIDAAAIVENLSECLQIGDILPTSESQCRELAKLPIEKQPVAWLESLGRTPKRRIPPARTIKSVVQEIKERDNTPPPIPYSQGEVLMIRGMGNPDLRKFDGRWAITLRINEYTVTLAVDGKELAVKPQFLEPVDPQYWSEIKAINERITRLQLEWDLDPAEDAVLEVLRRRTCFTPKQMMLLERMEQDYAKV